MYADADNRLVEYERNNHECCVMSIEQLPVTAERTDVAEYQNEVLGGALTEHEVRRFAALPLDKAKNAFTSAYLHTFPDAESDPQKLALLVAYYEHFFDGSDLGECADKYGVAATDVKKMSAVLPICLADYMPVSVWKDTVSSSDDAGVLRPDFESHSQNNVAVPDMPATVTDIASGESVDASDTDKTEQPYELEVKEEERQASGAEKVREKSGSQFDLAYDFFEAAEYIELDDQEWRQQGEAFFAQLPDVSNLKPAEATALWEHIVDKKEPSKMVSYAIDALRQQRKKVGSLPDGLATKIDWMLHRSAGKKVTIIDNLHKGLNRYKDTVTDAQTRCTATGLIYELYRPAFPVPPQDPREVESGSDGESFGDSIATDNTPSSTADNINSAGVFKGIDGQPSLPIVDLDAAMSVSALKKRSAKRTLATPVAQPAISIPKPSSLSTSSRQILSFNDLVSPDDPSLDWRDKGVCMQTDPEMFFPEKGGSTREAKQLCLGCEVIDQCLKYALDNNERFGIWGGMSERERREYKKQIS